jgi:hypothetical protein
MTITRFPRAFAVSAAVVGFYLVSCTEVPAPEGGVASISRILRPSPGLVVGDTMRDSTGVVMPLQVIAYGPDDKPLNPQPTPTFAALDTTAHLSGALLVGDRTGAVRIVGIVGSVQTRPDTIPVTLSPDTLVFSDSTLHRVFYTVTTDTVINSKDLGVFVQHRLPTVSGVPAVVVKYAITKSPTGNSTPTAVLLNGTRISDRDTSDLTGKASLVARLRLNALTTVATDTVQVNATASYRGRTLGVVAFMVVFTKQ